MKTKSLGANAILNGIKSMMSVLFPVITFPYVSRVLQVDNLGKYNFAQSVVSYFLLISALGISTYAIREGAKYRDNYEKINTFACEIFTINIASAIFAYILLAAAMILSSKLREYSLLILIFSIQIFFTTIGVEWIYSIFEDYAYITKRSIWVHIVSLVLLFTFVKKQDDYYLYALITVMASSGANIFNFIHSKKYSKIKLTKQCNYKLHIRSILIIFATSIAKTIYVNSDITILGFLTNDYCVGIYSVSAKIYRIVKTFLSAVVVVSVPRLSNYLSNNNIDRFNKTFQKIFNSLITFVVPAIVGLFMLSNEIILIIAEQSYIRASSSLRILSFSLFVCLFGWLYNSCVLIPYKRENRVLIATIVSAVLNVVLNIILIPVWKEDAAAFTTFISEACSMIICTYYSRDIVRLNRCTKGIVNSIIGCMGIIAACMIMRVFNLGTIAYTFFTVTAAIGVYGIILFILHDETILYIIKFFKKQLCNF